MSNEEKTKTDQEWVPLPEEDNTEKTWGDYIGYLVFPAFVLFFIIYIWLGIKSDQPSPDCVYTDRGCQGETTRYGQ